jgi:hypothetical protein
MTFKNTSGAVVATFAKPLTKDVWNCAGNLAAPNNIVGAISRSLCAALNRSTLGTTTTEPDYNAANFYKGALTNHYSRIVHNNMVDGKAYGFPFDDVGHFESLVHEANPSSATITLTTFGSGGPPPPPPTPGPTASPTPRPTPNPTASPTTPPGTTTWAPYTAYTTGQIVTYSGVRYQCRQAHTSIPGWEPPNVLALWLPI